MQTLTNIMNEGIPSNKQWIINKVFEFLSNNEYSLDNLESFAVEIDVSYEELLKHFFNIICSFFKEGKYIKKIKNDPDFKVNTEQLEIGIRYELEHTTDYNIAKRIALDHLSDCSTYYTKLEKLEKECNNE